MSATASGVAIQVDGSGTWLVTASAPGYTQTNQTIPLAGGAQLIIKLTPKTSTPSKIILQVDGSGSWLVSYFAPGFIQTNQAIPLDGGEQLTLTLTPQTSGGKSKLGFWVDARDIWSGGQYVKPSPSPQQFFNDYFLTPPFPAYMEWVSTLNPQGPYSPGPSGEISFLGQLASIADGYPNIRFHVRLFVESMWYCDGTVKDQSRLALLGSLAQTLAGHRSVIGIQEEPEYVRTETGVPCASGGPQLSAAFIQFVHSYNVKAISYQQSQLFDYTLNFDRWPSYTDPIILTLSGKSLGISWGDPGSTFVGQPNANPPPVWTQANVTTIIDRYSLPNAATVIQAWQDKNNPAGGLPGTPLWHSAMLRGWIWNDANYRAKFITSNGL